MSKESKTTEPIYDSADDGQDLVVDKEIATLLEKYEEGLLPVSINNVLDAARPIEMLLLARALKEAVLEKNLNWARFARQIIGDIIENTTGGGRKQIYVSRADRERTHKTLREILDMVKES